MTLKDKPPQVNRCPICYWGRVENGFQKEWRELAKVERTPSCGCVRDESKVWHCKEQYCIGTWNIRSMNQGELKVVKQVMAKVNILGISELKWTGMGEFNSNDHCIYHYGQESLRRNGVAIMVNKRVWNAVLGCDLKNEFSRLVSAQYATGEEWRNNSRKNEEMEPKQNQHPVMDATGDGSKVQCCEEQYCIGTWNVKPMNQGKLEVIKQEMARVNIDTFGYQWTKIDRNGWI